MVSNRIMTTKIRIGISSCLEGQEVRYDGGHKHNEYITSTLGRFFEFVPFCPEVAIGLGIPRPPIRLVRIGHAVHARGVRDAGLDVTDKLTAYADKVAPRLRDVSGYILKKNSPSCGLFRVKLYSRDGVPVGSTSGVFAGRLRSLVPELPFEEEGRLMDPVLRENFVERVFVYHRWQQSTRKKLTASAIVDFHTRHKFIVLAHDEKAYRSLGRLVAAVGSGSPGVLGQQYIRMLMEALAKPATRGRHSNVLEHLAGFFKKHMDTGDKRELQQVISNYRRGQIPLVVPITLLRHYLRRHPDSYLERQFYLAPHPDELMLRNLI